MFGDFYMLTVEGRPLTTAQSAIIAWKASEGISEPAKLPPVSFLHKNDKILKGRWQNNALENVSRLHPQLVSLFWASDYSESRPISLPVTLESILIHGKQPSLNKFTTII